MKLYIFAAWVINFRNQFLFHYNSCCVSTVFILNVFFLSENKRMIFLSLKYTSRASVSNFTQVKTKRTIRHRGTSIFANNDSKSSSSSPGFSKSSFFLCHCVSKTPECELNPFARDQRVELVPERAIFHGEVVSRVYLL